jgi:ubiquinone biosynthesis protein COQ4
MAVPLEEDDSSPEQALFSARMRDSHDLWHVVTGYGRDLLGESALLAFTYRQTRNPGIALIVLVAWWKAGRALPGARALIRDAYQRAGRAEWLPGVDWESMLERPLEEVRETLRVERVACYEAIRSAGAPRLV